MQEHASVFNSDNAQKVCVAYYSNITDNAIASAASRVVAKNSMINNPVMQANTVIQLGLPPVVPTIYVNSLTPNMA